SRAAAAATPGAARARWPRWACWPWPVSDGAAERSVLAAGPRAYDQRPATGTSMDRKTSILARTAAALALLTQAGCLGCANPLDRGGVRPAQARDAVVPAPGSLGNPADLADGAPATGPTVTTTNAAPGVCALPLSWSYQFRVP